ncbi:hypothetical protein LB505_014012 [Fusarium chuoi]|nr:hypothetical protein LB505_014012 [Fusarium chuoi]
MYQQQQVLSKVIDLAKNPKVQVAAGIFLALKSLGYLNAWYTKSTSWSRRPYHRLQIKSEKTTATRPF